MLPYSKFCKDGLMMVKRLKHVIIHTAVVTETRNYFVVFYFRLLSFLVTSME